MAETGVNIRIQALGGDEAAAALNKATTGLNNITSASGRMEEQFAHRFGHIGLQLFAADLLRANGLGGEGRQVIGLLNEAIMAAGMAFGAAAGPIMLVGAALAASIGIYEKVTAKHTETAASLKQLADQQEKERSSLQGEIDKLQGYKDELGHLPPAIEALLQAKIRLKQFEDNEEIQTLEKQIATTQQLIQEEKLHAQDLNFEQMQASRVTATRVMHIATTQGLYAAYQAVRQATTDYDAEIKKNNESIEKNNHDLAEATVRLQAAKAGTTDWEAALQKLSDAHKKAIQDAIDAANAEADAETALYQRWAEIRAKKLKEHQEMYKQFEDHAKGAIDTIDKTQSMAFAKWVVEGQSFAQATAHLWRDLAEQVIAQIEAMIVKMALLYAFTGGSMNSGGMAGQLLGFSHFASGGSFVARQATPIIVGEGGQPELVTVTPFSQMGIDSNGTGGTAGGVGTTINIGTIQTVVNEANDPEAIADQVGLKIAQRIRGQGEINFTRSF